MDLRSHNPFWLLKNGLVANYPPVSKNEKTKVAIIGAGISGALAAWHLCKAGVEVILVDKRHAGMGSTAASTALLQYEIDTPLVELCGYVGEKNAVKSYNLCLKAICDIENICKSLKHPADFALRQSFQYASYKKDVQGLEEEFLLRKKIGIKLNWLREKDIKDKWGFYAPAGILSKAGAQVDPYKLTHQLLQDSISKGLKIYDSTEIISIRHHKKGVVLITGEGYKIAASRLVMASGYESQKYIKKKVAKLNSTFAIISEPMQEKNTCYKNCLIWETATPYTYMRITADNRILVGGKDEEFSNPEKRDALLPKKVKDLEKTFAGLFPNTKFITDFQWAGTFASTKDGLPYIGQVKEQPHTFFALGFGGNGITYSVIAAQMITDAITGKKNDNMELFSFNR
jgi:glycine/D-amino acid oxidase-like deaminating enzyme